MTTTLSKPVRRKSNEVRRDRSKLRHLIVTLYPSGFIGLRLEGTRSEETIPMQAVYERAVKMRLAATQREREEKRAAKLGMTYGQYVRRKRR